jgi:hypothetical protein
MNFGEALDLAQEGLARWKDKEHNAKWWRRIDGTPIPNDLLVNIAEVFAQSQAGEAEKWKAENARNAAHVVDLQAQCDTMYADQLRTLEAVANAGAAIEKGHAPAVVLELLEKALTLHEKKRVNEAPKDGSTQAFDISFKARAFYDAEQRQWILTYPLSLQYLPTHARWLGPARTVDQPKPR